MSAHYFKEQIYVVKYFQQNVIHSSTSLECLFWLPSVGQYFLQPICARTFLWSKLFYLKFYFRISSILIHLYLSGCYICIFLQAFISLASINFNIQNRELFQPVMQEIQDSSCLQMITHHQTVQGSVQHRASRWFYCQWFCLRAHEGGITLKPTLSDTQICKTVGCY